jgi:hypothetical protein
MGALHRDGPAGLLEELFAEGRRKQPRDQIIEACTRILVSVLDELRIAAGNGDTGASAILEGVREALDAEVEAGGVDPGMLLIVARAFAQAGLDPGAVLQDAMAAKMEDPQPAHLALERAEEEIGGYLKELAAELDHNPFAIFDDAMEMAAAFPAHLRPMQAVALARSDVPSLREAAVGFVLAPEAEVGDATARLLVHASTARPVSAATVSRLIRIRPWLPETRRPAVDAAIKALRLKTEPPVAGPPHTDVLELFASVGDGAGATGLYAVARCERKFVMCSLLLKRGKGIADTVVYGGLSRRDADFHANRFRIEAGGVGVSRTFFERRLADALAENLARKVPPPFGLVHAAEVLGLGQLQPQAIEIGPLVEELLSDVPEKQKNEQAVRAAHRGTAMWKRQLDNVRYWFEMGAEVEMLLAPLKQRERAKAVQEQYLPARRAFWAERCAMAAATLKESAQPDDMFPELWLEFALVARDLVGGAPLSTITLMHDIAQTTVEVYEQRGR